MYLHLCGHRRSLQTLMIGSGLQKWVVELLREQDSLSEYTLRYSLALFMNLCLRTAGEKLGTESSLCVMLDNSSVFIAASPAVVVFAGKRACIPFSAATVKVLSELLEHDDQEV